MQRNLRERCQDALTVAGLHSMRWHTQSNEKRSQVQCKRKTVPHVEFVHLVIALKQKHKLDSIHLFFSFISLFDRDNAHG